MYNLKQTDVFIVNLSNNVYTRTLDIRSVDDISMLSVAMTTVTRDAPEATGDEPDDTDFDMPKIYEPVSPIMLHFNQLLYCVTLKYNMRSVLVIKALERFFQIVLSSCVFIRDRVILPAL